MSLRPDSRDPRLNITDQYVFDDGDATVFVMNTGASTAGFHHEARYEFRIHLDDALVENLTFRFAFDVSGFRLNRLEDTAAGDDHATGLEIAHGWTGQLVRGAQGVEAWAGTALDPFFADLTQVSAVGRLLVHGEQAEITGFLPGTVTNTFAGSTVHSIVLRVPHRDTRLASGRQIRVWSTTRLATDTGGWRQVSRAGIPMIWPLFRDESTRVGETHPNRDREIYGPVIQRQIAAAVHRLGTTDRPQAYAYAVTDRILPDTLPYRVGTPAVFGFAGFNGRRLGDNAAEVMFSLATDSAVGTGLTTGPHDDHRFPYVTPA